MIRIIFLGTNGWYDSSTGNTTSILIEHHNFYIILDAGNGISKLEQYINYDKPVYLFLSHFHIDHISGLHTLSKNKFSKNLYIIVQSGGEAVLRQFIKSPFMLPIEKLPFRTEIIEVNDNIMKLPFKVTFLPLAHTTVTLGARFEIDDKIITYCTDTSYCDNALILSKDADVLIAECSLRPNESNDINIHLNPESAARIALESNAKKLCLMHFDASRYKSMESREEAELSARKLFNNSYKTQDGMQIEV